MIRTLHFSISVGYSISQYTSKVVQVQTVWRLCISISYERAHQLQFGANPVLSCVRSPAVDQRTICSEVCCVSAILTKFQMGTTVDALALAVVLAQPFTPMVLSGAACKEHLESNYTALELLQRMDVATVTSLMDICISEPEEYWTERSNMSWN